MCKISVRPVALGKFGETSKKQYGARSFHYVDVNKCTNLVRCITEQRVSQLYRPMTKYALSWLGWGKHRPTKPAGQP